MTFLKNLFSNFRSHIKDSKWGRKCIFINCTSYNGSPQQIQFQFANGKLSHSCCRGFLGQYLFYDEKICTVVIYTQTFIEIYSLFSFFFLEYSSYITLSKMLIFLPLHIYHCSNRSSHMQILWSFFLKISRGHFLGFFRSLWDTLIFLFQGWGLHNGIMGVMTKSNNLSLK